MKNKKWGFQNLLVASVKMPIWIPKNAEITNEVIMSIFNAQ